MYVYLQDYVYKLSDVLEINAIDTEYFIPFFLYFRTQTYMLVWITLYTENPHLHSKVEVAAYLVTLSQFPTNFSQTGIERWKFMVTLLKSLSTNGPNSVMAFLMNLASLATKCTPIITKLMDKWYPLVHQMF